MSLTMRQWRLARELTINDMAKACKVHPNTYAAWEKEPGKVKVDDAFRIASALGVTIDDIFFNVDTTKCCKEGA